MQEIRLKTERKTQLVNITEQVREAVGEGSAALVYVPHTTAAVTINEHLDPALLQDIEEALGRIVDDGWTWRHDDVDGPNAPSHMRASLLGPQVLVPLDGGALALGFDALYLPLDEGDVRTLTRPHDLPEPLHGWTIVDAYQHELPAGEGLQRLGIALRRAWGRATR